MVSNIISKREKKLARLNFLKPLPIDCGENVKREQNLKDILCAFL